jgi:hypothetical protein
MIMIVVVFCVFCVLCFVWCAHSGAWSNYLEVGGDDTAMLNACWNTISSSTAIVIPYLVRTTQMRLTTSVLPLPLLLAAAAAVDLISAPLLCVCVRVSSLNRVTHAGILAGASDGDLGDDDNDRGGLQSRRWGSLLCLEFDRDCTFHPR